MQPAQSAALHTIIATLSSMHVLAAITLLAGASALVPPPQQLGRNGVALRAGFGAATKKSKAKFVKPGKKDLEKQWENKVVL